MCTNYYYCLNCSKIASKTLKKKSGNPVCVRATWQRWQPRFARENIWRKRNETLETVTKQFFSINYIGWTNKAFQNWKELPCEEECVFLSLIFIHLHCWTMDFYFTLIKHYFGYNLAKKCFLVSFWHFPYWPCH